MMTGWLGLYSPLYMVFCFQSLTSTSCRPHMSSSSSFSSKICSRFCGTRALNPFISAFIWSSTRDTNRHLITRLHTRTNGLFNNTLNTFYWCLYGVGHSTYNLFNNILNTFYWCLYGVGLINYNLFNNILNTFYWCLYGVGHINYNLFNNILNTFYWCLYGVGHINYNLFNNILNTFYWCLYGVGHINYNLFKIMFYLTIYSIHFIDVYMVSDIVIIIYLKLCFI